MVVTYFKNNKQVHVLFTRGIWQEGVVEEISHSGADRPVFDWVCLHQHLPLPVHHFETFKNSSSFEFKILFRRKILTEFRFVTISF